MKAFAGFPPGKATFTPVPDLFFSELLAAIDDLAELKLTLYMFWALQRQRGYPRYMRLDELETEGSLLAALKPREEDDALAILHDAVKAAVARGTLLRVVVSSEGATDGESAAEGQSSETHYLFMNTAQGRKAVREVTAGELLLETRGTPREAHIARERPRIYTLYEQNIGLLQPLLVEELAEAEDLYPPEWIEDAFRIAVERNARNWRYIRSILERWAREGKDSGDRSLARPTQTAPDPRKRKP